MTLDGFKDEHKQAFNGYSAVVARRFGDAVDSLGRRLDVRIEGLEKIPSGRALLVANHAFGFVDVAFAMARIQAMTGRRVWALGEHAWWRIPGIRRLAAAYGTVDGTQDNVDHLLSSDELVLVLPGGLRESMKPRELRYRLLWGQRYGFVRAAIRHATPIVPLASLGADDVFDLIGDAFARARKLHLPFPLPRPAHLLPIVHLKPLRFVVGDPVPTSEGDDPRRVRREVEGALHEIFEEELLQRAHFCCSEKHHRGESP